MTISETPIALAIELLSGGREEEFAFEPELRLFQFKAWLLGDRSQDQSFRQSALIFASLVIRQRSVTLRKRLRSPKASEVLLLTISQPDVRPLIDHAFDGGLTLHSLTQIAWLPYREADIEGDKKEIEHLNMLSEFRMRLTQTKGFDSSINKAAALYAHSNFETKCSESKVEGIHRRRIEREAFLLAAAKAAPHLLSFEPDYKNVLASIEKEAEDIESLKSFCARTKSILPVLNPELAKALEKSWSHIQPDNTLTFEPISQAELDAADIAPTVRRSAVTTKAGDRQARPRVKKI
ncbi:MAG: hypothetical protein ABSD90_11730 [Methylocystis sp.]